MIQLVAMNKRLESALKVKVADKPRHSTVVTGEIRLRYAESQMLAISRLPEWEGRQSLPGWLKRANNRARVNWNRAKKSGRLPQWADRSAILSVYMRAAMLNLHCDHHYPLKGKRISGLHVAENLVICTASYNAAKAADSPNVESNY